MTSPFAITPVRPLAPPDAKWIVCPICHGQGESMGGWACSRCDGRKVLCAGCYEPSSRCSCRPENIVLEVRCCCNPNRLLGHIRVPLGVEGKTAVCLLINNDDGTFTGLDLPIKAVGRAINRGYSTVRYKAVASNETPLETLRRVPGFEENLTYVDR